MNAKRVLIGFMLILILAYLGFRGYQEYLAPVDPTPTPAFIESGPVTINAEGRVVPSAYLAQAFEIPGRVAEIHVSEGDRVKAGDPLLNLEKDSLQAQVDQAEAALKAARAELKMLPKSVSEDQEDRAEARVQGAEAALDAARVQRRKADLEASLDGVVTSVEVESGQVVDAGMPVVIVADLASWQVDTLDLLEEDVVDIEVGQPAVVKFAAYPDRSLDGRVSEIAYSASSYQGNVTYTVTVDLASTGDLNLQWGMTAFVEIDPDAQPIGPAPTPTPAGGSGGDNGQEPTPAPTPTPTNTPAPEPEEEQEQAGEQRVPGTYTVRPGEYAFCLGRRFDIKPDDLLAHNGLPPGSELYPGQVLQIPPDPRRFPVGRVLAPHPTRYVVQPGDTLPIIACQFGDLYPAEIARANGLSPGAVLSPGQELQIP